MTKSNVTPSIRNDKNARRTKLAAIAHSRGARAARRIEKMTMRQARAALARMPFDKRFFVCYCLDAKETLSAVRQNRRFMRALRAAAARA